MRPGSYPLTLYRGDSYHWKFVLWTDEEKSQALDLTGATAKAEIRNASAGAEIIPLACTIIDPNIVDVILSTAAWSTTPMVKPSCQWDLQVTFATGEVYTVVAGAVSIRPDITDSVPLPAVGRAGR